MARICVIGSNGQLGFDLMRTGRPGDELVGLTHSDIEIIDPQSVERVLTAVKPDVVINTAAFHKTELCEQEPERAFKVNAAGAHHVARLTAGLGGRTVYISTDYVFGGSQPSFTPLQPGRPIHQSSLEGENPEAYWKTQSLGRVVTGFSEADCPQPLNVYGASKYAGELATRIADPRSYVVRTGWLFGKNVSHKGYNFVTLMREKAKTEPEVRVVNDQRGSPTYTLDLAAKIHELISAGAPAGTYHITSGGNATWYELAKATFELSGLAPTLTPITTAESGTKIRRPTFSVLENMKLQEIGLAPMRPWREALAAYLDEIGIR